MRRFWKKVAATVIVIAVTTLSVSTSARAAETCGLWSEKGKDGESALRFRLLKDLNAFLDLQTCLVWSLRVYPSPVTMADAARLCNDEGQGGGGGGAMGWRLPSVAELTSVEGGQWKGQRPTFELYKLPPVVRMEVPFWTTTLWPPDLGSWSVVMFSARTTFSYPVKKDATAGAWCVRCCPATGLR